MRFIKYLLFPFSLLYLLGLKIYKVYEVRKVVSFEGIKTIGIGNLSVGGTGKTPLTEYITRSLISSHKVAILSRGYKRKSKGFYLANEAANWEMVGDEPFQLFSELKGKVPVAVSENRKIGIEKVRLQYPEVNTIILDDAFQQWSIKLDLRILLTEYSHLFTDDYVLPMGYLREPRKEAKRADVLIITKCPSRISLLMRKEVVQKVKKYIASDAPIFFCRIQYQTLRSIDGTRSENPIKNIIAFSGIARPNFFFDHLKKQYTLIDCLSFPDHVNYSQNHISKIVTTYYKYAKQYPNLALVTTQKDSVKLHSLAFKKLLLRNISIYYLPIQIDFFEDNKEFLKKVHQSIIFSAK